MARPRLHLSAGKLAGRDPSKILWTGCCVQIENTACGHRLDDERQLRNETCTTSWSSSAPAVQVDQQRLALLQGAE